MVINRSILAEAQVYVLSVKIKRAQNILQNNDSVKLASTNFMLLVCSYTP